MSATLTPATSDRRRARRTARTRSTPRAVLQVACAGCDGEEWVCAATGRPADLEHGACCTTDGALGLLEPGGCSNAEPCPDCQLTGDRDDA